MGDYARYWIGVLSSLTDLGIFKVETSGNGVRVFPLFMFETT